jgi:hypothetical protein
MTYVINDITYVILIYIFPNSTPNSPITLEKHGKSKTY